VSVFVFDRKSIEPAQGSIASRQSSMSLKKAHDEVVERLRKEASSLARLRHPNILELQEPVEDTRNGGLMFATEPVTASLAGLLEEKDGQERAGGIGGRSSRFVVEDSEGGRRRREVEIDELEIQKGLIQIGKGLEFLHESAGLVHGNLTPEAIFLNVKSDWKISGLGFSTPTDQSTNGAVPTLILSEVLNYDARLPRSVQLDIDYASPDFVMDNNINTSADIFSLGLLIIALFNSPHRTPLNTNFSVSTYKKMLASPSTTPTQSNNYLSTRPIPKEILTSVLPRLITRRPAQRFSAREFQQAQYFDSILVSTIRFLDSLPAKTPAEKSAFMRGLPRILPQFPKSVLEKKVLPALLDETKDHEVLSLTLQNVFKVLSLVPNSKRALSDKIVPALREVFLSPVKARKGQKLERDTSTDGGLMVVMENMTTITTSCTSKEFKDDILPIVFIALDSATHSLQDAALHDLPAILPVLDFSTVKNELFPVVAQVFSKTSSLAIKVSGLEAFATLCGGNASQTGTSSISSSAILDKHTIQEKVVPLLKVIKTKEPAVMMAALSVFEQVGKIADIEFLANDVLPCLWQFSLGPLLNLEQFQSYITLIKALSTRIEQEQMRKLQNLSTAGRSGANSARTNGFATGQVSEETDFESLVTGRQPGQAASDGFDDGWGGDSAAPAMPTLTPTWNQHATQQQPPSAATFSWSTPVATTQQSRSQPQTRASTVAAQPYAISRTVTPDNAMGSFTTLSPAKSGTQMNPMRPLAPKQTQSVGSSVDWSTAMAPPSNNWSTPLQPQPYNVAPPSLANMTISASAMKPLPPPAQNNGFGATTGPSNGLGFGQTGAPKQGMEKYESLL
jgi:SCY1-like protein 2